MAASIEKAFQGDEEKIIDLIRGRLRLGEQRYGALNLHDSRNKLEEALEEVLDLAIYLTTQIVFLKEQPSGSSAQSD